MNAAPVATRRTGRHGHARRSDSRPGCANGWTRRIAKLAARPVHRDGDTVTIAVDDDTELRLHAPGGVVATADAITCGCLLAPACVHRAAAACAAPIGGPGAGARR